MNATRPDNLSLAPRWLYAWALLVAPLLYGASFPLWDLWWAAWIGLALWCVALRVARTRKALAIACASTFLGSYVCTTWLPNAVANYYQQPLALGLALFAGVYAVTVGPYVIAFTLGYRWLARRPSAWLPLLAGAAWAAAEVGRVRLLVGNPFGLFGYSQTDVTALVQIADVTGVYGVSAILIAVNAAVAELWLAYRGGREAASIAVCTRTQARRGLILVAASLTLINGYGIVRMRAFDGAPAMPMPIAIVQGNLDVGSQWRRELYGENFDAYVRLSAASATRREAAAGVLAGERDDVLSRGRGAVSRRAGAPAGAGGRGVGWRRTPNRR